MPYFIYLTATDYISKKKSRVFSKEQSTKYNEKYSRR